MAEPVEILRFTCGPFEENPYLVVGPSGTRAMIVDPGLGSETILDAARARGLEISLIVNTHGHLDHIAGNRFYKDATGAPIAIHRGDVPLLENLRRQGALWGFDVADSPPPDVFLEEGTALPFDGVSFEILHTPGHTPGGVCLRLGPRILVGDTLFQGSVGRTDLPGGDWAALEAAIRGKLFTLPDETVCLPGHGPETTIGHERRTNPFVGEPAGGLAGGRR
jgi:glyoxylase-like metal-dependent hydrolase (beta-lactamase superfamily II)